VTLLAAELDVLVQRVALRVVELLDQRDRPAELIDAAGLARLLGVSRATIYEHREQLGAIHIGDGDRPRLRFDAEKARAAWTRRVPDERSEAPDSPAPIAVPRRRRAKRSGSEAGLLPVRGPDSRRNVSNRVGAGNGLARAHARPDAVSQRVISSTAGSAGSGDP
jgi:hypothetical protein